MEKFFNVRMYMGTEEELEKMQEGVKNI